MEGVAGKGSLGRESEVEGTECACVCVCVHVYACVYMFVGAHVDTYERMNSSAAKSQNGPWFEGDPRKPCWLSAYYRSKISRELRGFHCSEASPCFARAGKLEWVKAGLQSNDIWVCVHFENLMYI